MIPLLPPKVVKSETEPDWRSFRSKVARARSVACFTRRRFKLIQLRIMLAGEPAFLRFAVEVGARTIVERCVQVNPDLNIGIALVWGSLWRFGEAEANQKLVEHGKVGVRSGLFMPIRSPGSSRSGTRSSVASGADRVIF